MGKTFSKIRKVEDGLLSQLDLTESITIIKHDLPYNIWSAYNTKDVSIVGKIVYTINTPIFTNLQWCTIINDGPVNDGFALLFSFGLLRDEITSIKMFGDYMNQSFDITHLVKPEIIKQMNRKYSKIDRCYNQNDASIQGVNAILNGMINKITIS